MYAGDEPLELAHALGPRETGLKNIDFCLYSRAVGSLLREY